VQDRPGRDSDEEECVGFAADRPRSGKSKLDSDEATIPSLARHDDRESTSNDWNDDDSAVGHTPQGETAEVEAPLASPAGHKKSTGSYWNHLAHGRTLGSGRTALATNNQGSPTGVHAASERPAGASSRSGSGSGAPAADLFDELGEDDAISVGGASTDNELDDSRPSLGNGSSLGGSGTLDLASRLAAERSRLAKMEAQLEAEELQVLGEDEHEDAEADAQVIGSGGELELDSDSEKEGGPAFAGFASRLVENTLASAVCDSESESESDDGAGAAAEDDRGHAGRLRESARSPPLPSAQEKAGSQSSAREEAEGSGDRELDLVFDPILECYFCPRTNKYYRRKDSAR